MNITPCIFCKNEEYWIGYVLRDLLKVFPEVVLFDTGSADQTLNAAGIVEKAVSGGKLRVYQANYGDDSHRIGNAPNILRGIASTKWMLLVGGDEVWLEEQLLELVRLMDTEAPDNMQVGMVLGKNVIHHAGDWHVRDQFNADRLFDQNVEWHRTNYPYEDHGLYDKVNEAGVVHYFNTWFWHARHLDRSSKDNETFYRVEKQDFFGKPVKLDPIDNSWYGKPNFANSYIAEVESV